MLSAITPFPPPSQNQAKLFIEQKKIPFPVDNHNVNEELGKFVLHRSTNLVYAQDLLSLTFFFFCTPAIGYVLIGNGLYDEAIKHFSLLLQVRIWYFSHWRSLKLARRCSWRFVSVMQGDPELVSAIYGRGMAYGKKSLQVSNPNKTRGLVRPVQTTWKTAYMWHLMVFWDWHRGRWWNCSPACRLGLG